MSKTLGWLASELGGELLGNPEIEIRRVVNPAHAEKLFAGSGHTFQEIVALLGTEKPLPHFPLTISIRADLRKGMRQKQL